MTPIRLLHTTGSGTVDATLRDTVGAFEAAFPQRVRGYYALGSFADGSDVSTSDLDLTLVFAGALSGAEREAAGRLASRLAERSAVELDIELADEAELERGASPTFKLGSAPVYGEDIRARVPLVSLQEWTRDRMHSSYWRIARLFARPTVLSAPLGYPEPDDEFFGYTRRTMRLRDGREVPGARDLIRLTGWAATALLAYERGVYVARKSACHTLYREHIGDEWSDLLEDTYALCRTRWAYLIPDDPAERALLRELCARTLAFENAFLARYTSYLLGELRGEDGGVRVAAEVMARAPYRDAEVIGALEALTEREDVGIREAAQRALAQYTAP